MAVYTKVGRAALETILSAYDIGTLEDFQGIRTGVQNTNYRLHTTDGKFILTLYEATETGVNADDLPFFLGLMQHLAAGGIACPTPMHRCDGGLLGEIDGRPAAIVRFLEGTSVISPKPNHCRAIGASIAAVHLVGDSFTSTRANGQSRTQWSELLDLCAERADEVAPDMALTVRRELDRILQNWPTGLPFGVIHADVFPDNVFFTNGVVSGLIDFYFSCNDAYAYDLAIMLNAWCFEADINFNITKARALLAGYQSVRHLSVKEIEALPVLASGAAMRFLLTRLYDWLHRPDAALVTPKNPTEYLRRLRFHKNVRSPADYGLELE